MADDVVIYYGSGVDSYAGNECNIREKSRRYFYFVF